MMNSDDYFVLGLVFASSPFLVFLFRYFLDLGDETNPYIASLVGTIGILFLITSIIR